MFRTNKISSKIKSISDKLPTIADLELSRPQQMGDRILRHVSSGGKRLP